MKTLFIIASMLTILSLKINNHIIFFEISDSEIIFIKKEIHGEDYIELERNKLKIDSIGFHFKDNYVFLSPSEKPVNLTKQFKISNKFLHDCINPLNIPNVNICYFIISSEGKVLSYGLKNSFYTMTDKCLIEKLAKVDTWKPAINDNMNVASIVFFQINHFPKED